LLHAELLKTPDIRVESVRQFVNDVVREGGTNRAPEEEGGATAQDDVVDVAAVFDIAPQVAHGLLGDLPRSPQMRLKVVGASEDQRLRPGAQREVELVVVGVLGSQRSPDLRSQHAEDVVHPALGVVASVFIDLEGLGHDKIESSASTIDNEAALISDRV